MKMFMYDNASNRVELNEPEILLIREFKALMDRDKTKSKTRAFREFTYIYLAIDWRSPYSDYTEQEKHEEALNDASITEEEFNDPLFREACRKYRNLLESNRSIKLLNAAQNVVDLFVDYFEQIVDLSERDATGKPIFSAEKVMKEMSLLNKVHDELASLKEAVLKELSEKSTLRAGATADFNPGKI